MTLQAALPRELYVDPAAFERERGQVLLREWTCVGRAADLGLHEPEQVAVVEVLDESVVLTTDAGGALHAASGFTCPAAIDGFKRDRLTVYDAAQGGRDVSCGYASSPATATATLYLTKLPAQYTLTRVFDTYVEQAKVHTPSVGDVADPYPTSEGGPRRQGRFWRDKEGRNEGLWLVQIGPWFAKLRVTYADTDVATVRRLAADLLTAIDAQVKPPTV